MNAKFAVNLADYVTHGVECPGCHVKYLLKLRLGHSALASQNGRKTIFILCPDCARAKGFRNVAE